MDYKKLRDTRNSTNPYAKRMGIFVEEIGPGCARAVMDVTPDDANPVGVPHGGCYFSLADTASGSATASHGYYAVTISAAYQYFEEDQKGSIREGKRADFVVLDQNPLTADPERIRDIRVLRTIKDGVTVYEC